MATREIAKPITYKQWRGRLLRREPNATINSMSDERGVVAAEAVVEQTVVATWALGWSYEASDQANRLAADAENPSKSSEI